MSFKEDIKNIELPKELHERSKKGINRAEREKKKINLKPVILTFIVTAAMLLFVFSQLNGGTSTDVTTAALRDNGMPSIAISIAYIVTIVAIISLVFLWRKKRVSRLLLILSFMALMSTTWITSLKYTYELLDIEIYPIKQMDFLLDDPAGRMQYSLHYMKPKSKDKYVRSIFINDNPVSITHRLEKEGQPRLFSYLNDHEIIQFTVPNETVEIIKNDEKIKVQIMFTDYTQVEMELESFNVYVESNIEQLFSKSFLSTPNSTHEFQLSEDTFIEKIHLPHQLVGHALWNLQLNDQVIKEGIIIDQEIDLSLNVSKTDRLKLHLEIPELYQPIEEWVYFTENKKVIFLDKVYHDNIIDKTYLKLIVEKQRGEQRDN